MKEVIERMLKVEEEAREVLAEAEKLTRDIAEKARRDAYEQGEKLRIEAHAEATKRVEESRTGLKGLRDERLAGFDRANETYTWEVRQRLPQAVDAVVRKIVGERS